MGRRTTDVDKVAMWLEWGINLDSRTVTLDDDVDDASMGAIIRGIHLMERSSTEQPITVSINTEGGECYSGFALYDVLRASPCPVHTVALGKVMSMGTVIMLAGDVKFSYPTTTFMWHSPSSEGGKGKLFEGKIDVKETERILDLMLNIYTTRSREKSRNWWRTWLQYKDQYGPVARAVELGFVDEVLGETEERT